jgi:hypothetical protein
MEYDELMALIEIRSPKELVYFEQFAELVEIETYLSADALAQLFEDADKDALAELTEGYFEDILKFIPEDATEFYTLLSTIGRQLTGLAQVADPDPDSTSYADEFFRFRNWYTFESEVRCVKEDNENEVTLPVAQALALYRSEHLNDEIYEYDFSDVLDYPIDEYMMSIDSLIDEEDDYSDDDESWAENHS